MMKEEQVLGSYELLYSELQVSLDNTLADNLMAIWLTDRYTVAFTQV